MGAKGGKLPSALTPQAAKHIRLQGSQFGDVIPIGYGEHRCAGNIALADFFTSKDAQGATSASGQKGGAITPQGFLYFVSTMHCLGEGGWWGSSILERVNLGLARPGRQAISTTEGAMTGADGQPTAGGKANLQPIGGVDAGVWKSKRVRAAGKKSGKFRPANFRTYSPGVFLSRPGDQPVELFTGSQHDKLTTPGTIHYAPERYPGFAILVNEKMALGANANLPNWNFPARLLQQFADTDCAGGVAFDGSMIYDAAPDRIAADLLLNPKHGVGLDGFPTIVPGYDSGSADASPFWYTGADTWGAWNRANDLLISPYYDQQRPLTDMLADLCLTTNSAGFYSEGRIKVIPYGDRAVPASTRTGVAFTPSDDPDTITDGVNLAIRGDLTVADFLEGGGDRDEPVKVTRKSLIPNKTDSAGYVNAVRIEWEDRLNAYVKGVANATDEASIQINGMIAGQPYAMAEICTAELANDTAWRILQRFGAVRNIYKFKLSYRWDQIEPMDFYTLTEPGLRLDKRRVRITKTTEGVDGTIEVEAEAAPRAVAPTAPAVVPPPDDSLEDGAEVWVGGFFVGVYEFFDADAHFADFEGQGASEFNNSGSGPNIPDACYQVAAQDFVVTRAAVTLESTEQNTELVNGRPFVEGVDYVYPFYRFRILVEGTAFPLDPDAEIWFSLRNDVGQTRFASGEVLVRKGQRYCVELRVFDAPGVPRVPTVTSVYPGSATLNWSITTEPA